MKHQNLTDKQLKAVLNQAVETVGKLDFGIFGVDKHKDFGHPDYWDAHELDALRAIIDALPEPAADDWEACAFEDIRKGDRVKWVHQEEDREQVTTGIAHRLAYGDEAWVTESNLIIADISVEGQFHRIPAPVQRPDPEVHRVIYVHATTQQRYDSLQEYPSPVFHFHWSDNKWRGDISTVLNTEDILEWEPAAVVPANEGKDND